jgi:hypothetical protein
VLFQRDDVLADEPGPRLELSYSYRLVRCPDRWGSGPDAAAVAAPPSAPAAPGADSVSSPPPLPATVPGWWPPTSEARATGTAGSVIASGMRPP